MSTNYPFTLNSVLPTQQFFSLRDEFLYTGWSLTNYSGYKVSESDKLSWKLNEPNNKLIIYQCASIIKLKLKKYLQQELVFFRAHSNGQTFGQDTEFHLDFHEDDVWTFVLFTEDYWNTQWSGEFVALDPTTNQYKYTTYIPNTGVLIPSNWLHCGMAPNRFTDKLRTSIAFSYSSLQSFESIKEKKISKSFL